MKRDPLLLPRPLMARSAACSVQLLERDASPTAAGYVHRECNHHLTMPALCPRQAPHGRIRRAKTDMERPTPDTSTVHTKHDARHPYSPRAVYSKQPHVQVQRTDVPEFLRTFLITRGRRQRSLMRAGDSPIHRTGHLGSVAGPLLMSIPMFANVNVQTDPASQ